MIFQDSFRCNFLGLEKGVEIPSHVLQSDLFVLVDIDASKEVCLLFFSSNLNGWSQVLNHNDDYSQYAPTPI